MNKFIWYDLMTPNADQVGSFYEKVIGWNIADSGMPGMDYNIISAGDTMVGGIMGLPPGGGDMRPPWHGHIWSADVDADCQRVIAAGGKVHQAAQDIPGIGRFAVASDPGGASFILFKPNSSEQPKPVAAGTPGHIGWRELHAADGAKAWDFYEKLFAWKKLSDMPMGPQGNYRIFSCGDDASAGGMMTKMPDTANPIWLYYFNVDGTATAAAERIRKAKGKVAMGPHQVPTGQWIVVAEDTEGHLFGILSATE